MMNDLNLPVFLAEFLAKSAIVVALGLHLLRLFEASHPL